tara:strand:+ start:77 stop:298 length:222 start_codon:yes stop_codon:yes gene_type:complete
MHKTKTFWASVTGIVTAVGAHFTGDIDLAATMQIVITSVLAIFLRHGVAKSEKAAEKKPAGNYAAGASYSYRR